MMRISLDGSFCLLAAVLLLSLPLPWLLAAAAAAMAHEMCHLLALGLTGTKILGLRIGMGGARIETLPMAPKTELICAAAGPVGSLLLISLIRIFPRVALCAAVQGFFNLLPVLPLDGGRILRCGAVLAVPKWADRIVCVTQWTALALTVLLCVRFSLAPLGVFLILGLLPRMLRRKIPCKESKLAVQ